MSLWMNCLCMTSVLLLFYANQNLSRPNVQIYFLNKSVNERIICQNVYSTYALVHLPCVTNSPPE